MPNNRRCGGRWAGSGRLSVGPVHTMVEAYYDGRWHYLDVLLKFYARRLIATRTRPNATKTRKAGRRLLIFGCQSWFRAAYNVIISRAGVR